MVLWWLVLLHLSWCWVDACSGRKLAFIPALGNYRNLQTAKQHRTAASLLRHGLPMAWQAHMTHVWIQLRGRANTKRKGGGQQDGSIFLNLYVLHRSHTYNQTNH